jgi:Leucine-rich repeat (LRR) protein
MRCRTSRYLDSSDEEIDTTYYDKTENYLDIAYLRLKTYDLHGKGKYITKLFIDHNTLRKLPSPSEIPNLKELNCSNNILQNIPLYPKLKCLNIDTNKITSLQNYENSILKQLICCNNSDININIKLPELTHLFSSHNRHKSIDLKNYKRLLILDISHNNITNISFHNNCILKELCIENNVVTEIPVLNTIKAILADDNNIKQIHSYPNLKILSVNNNKITSINDNPKLKSLQARNNRLLKIGYYSQLEILDVSDNQLDSVKIGSHLRYIYTYGNYLSKLHISACVSNLIEIHTDFNTYKYIYSKYYDNFSYIDSNIRPQIKSEYTETNEKLINIIKQCLSEIKLNTCKQDIKKYTYNIFVIYMKRYPTTNDVDMLNSIADIILKIYKKSLKITIYFNYNKK